MTSLIAGWGSGRSTSFIPALPATRSVTTMAFIVRLSRVSCSRFCILGTVAGTLRVSVAFVGIWPPRHSTEVANPRLCEPTPATRQHSVPDKAPPARPYSPEGRLVHSSRGRRFDAVTAHRLRELFHA